MMRRTFPLVALLLLWALLPSSLAANARTPLVRTLFSLSLTGEAGVGTWSNDGSSFVFHQSTSAGAKVCLVERASKKLRILFRSRNGYWPVFGPLKSILSGPRRDRAPLALPRPTPRKRHALRRKPPVPRRPRGKTTQRARPVVRSVAPKKSTPPLSWGIRLTEGAQRTLLFPGVRPRYSHPARRLVFSYRGVLYLWNPMQSTRKLLMLARGTEPRWSPNGRAMLFLQRPFSKGGGVWVVDMRFRAAKLTNTGGEAVWGPGGKTLYFTGKHPASKTWGIAALLLKGKKPKPRWIVRNGRSAALPPAGSKLGAPLMAYHNSKGTWVQHLQTGKRLLVARGGKNPRWSRKGELLVHFPKALRLYSLTPAGIATLSQK